LSLREAGVGLTYARIAHELLGQLNKANKDWRPEIVPVGLMREIVIAVEDCTITGMRSSHLYPESSDPSPGTTGKAVIRYLVDSDITPPFSSLSDILVDLNLAPVSSNDLHSTCEAAIAALPDAADKVRKGKEKAVAKIVGEVMRLRQGRADASGARKIILEILRDAS